MEENINIILQPPILYMGVNPKIGVDFFYPQNGRKHQHNTSTSNPIYGCQPKNRGGFFFTPKMEENINIILQPPILYMGVNPKIGVDFFYPQNGRKHQHNTSTSNPIYGCQPKNRGGFFFTPKMEENINIILQPPILYMGVNPKIGVDFFFTPKMEENINIILQPPILYMGVNPKIGVDFFYPQNGRKHQHNTSTSNPIYGCQPKNRGGFFFTPKMEENINIILQPPILYMGVNPKIGVDFFYPQNGRKHQHNTSTSNPIYGCQPKNRGGFFFTPKMEENINIILQPPILYMGVNPKIGVDFFFTPKMEENINIILQPPILYMGVNPKIGVDFFYPQNGRKHQHNTSTSNPIYGCQPKNRGGFFFTPKMEENINIILQPPILYMGVNPKIGVDFFLPPKWKKTST